MKPEFRKIESGFVRGLVLLLFGVLGALPGWVSVLSRSQIRIDGAPASLALACGFCGLVVLLCATVDRSDGANAVGAYALIGRWYAWLGALCAALSLAFTLTRTYYVDDLVRPDKLVAIVPLAAAFAVLFAYLLLRTRGQAVKPQARKGKRSALKAGLAFILCALAMVLLYQRYLEGEERAARYARSDEAARRSAPPWVLTMDALRGGMSVDELKALARTTGHSLKCYGNLRSEERIRADDQHACWTMIAEAWGIPALMTNFSFSERGLRAQVIHFPESSWPQVQRLLDETAPRLPHSFGLDAASGKAILGWRIDSGLLNSAPPSSGDKFIVTWTAKRELAIENCPYQGAAARRKPKGQWLSIAQLWPELDCSKLP